MAGLSPPALTFVVPFLGPLVALATPFTAITVGRRVWHAKAWQIVVAGVLLLVAMWVAVFFVASSMESASDAPWLLIPLCAPTGAAAIVVPAAAAAVTYAAVCLVSVRTRRLWIWPIGGLVTGLAYGLTWAAIGESVTWIC